MPDAEPSKYVWSIDRSAFDVHAADLLAEMGGLEGIAAALRCHVKTGLYDDEVPLDASEKSFVEEAIVRPRHRLKSASARTE